MATTGLWYMPLRVSDYLLDSRLFMVARDREAAFVRLLFHAWTQEGCKIAAPRMAYAAMARANESEVDSILGDLAKAGLLRVTSNSSDGTISVSFPEWAKEQKSRVAEAERKKEERKRKKTDPEPYPEPEPEPAAAKAASAGHPPDAGNGQVEEVVAHYVGKRPLRRPGKDERAKIAARLKEGFTVAELKQAIDGCLKAPFVNDGGKVHDSLELIVRNSSKVNQYRAAIAEGGGDTQEVQYSIGGRPCTKEEFDGVTA